MVSCAGVSNVAVIVTSQVDRASLNIWQKLIENFSFKETNETFNGNPIYTAKNVKLVKTRVDLIFAGQVEKHFNDNLFIFASRHESASKFPSLLVHPTGNWSKNVEFGGKPFELSLCPASKIKLAIKEIESKYEDYGLSDWKIGLEATHHGPFTRKPSFFIEIGSSIEEWENRKAGELIADVIVTVVGKNEEFDAVVGFGGPHYAPLFTKVALETEFAVGHVAPKYVFPLEKDMVEKAFTRTMEKTSLALIDRKGIKREFREELVSYLRELSLHVVEKKDLF